MTRAVRAGTTVLLLGACALLAGGVPTTAAVALGVGAAVAGERSTGPLLAVLALFAGASAVSAPLPDAAGWLGGIAAGLGLGALARSAAPGIRYGLVDGGAGSGALLCGLAGMLALLPDGTVALFRDGAPLHLHATVQSAEAGLRAAVEPRAVLHRPPPASGVRDVLRLAAPLAAWGLLLAAVRDEARTRRIAWALAAAVGIALTGVGLAGLAQLLGGPIELPPAGELARGMQRRASGAAAVTVSRLPERAELGLASRPMVDPLRTLGGLVLLALAIRRLREPTPTATPPAAGGPLLPLAVALLAVGAALLAPGAAAWFVAGAGVLVVAAQLGGLFAGVGRVGLLVALTAGLAIQVGGWLALAAGWVGPW